MCQPHALGLYLALAQLVGLFLVIYSWFKYLDPDKQARSMSRPIPPWELRRWFGNRGAPLFSIGFALALASSIVTFVRLISCRHS